MERNKLQKQLGFVQLAETMIISLVTRKEADEKEEQKENTIGMGKYDTILSFRHSRHLPPGGGGYRKALQHFEFRGFCCRLLIS